MKLSNYIILVIGLSLFPSYMMGEDLIVDSVKYSYTSITTASVVGYVEGLTSAIIPDSLNGHEITSIGDNCFNGCSSLSYVHIPEGVTSIGACAFGGCSSLTSLVIPNSVTAIEWGAFNACSSLLSFNIPDGVKSIGRHTFQDCSSLVSISIPTSVTSIEGLAFNQCASLVSIVFPVGVKRVEGLTFQSCYSLKNVEIPGVIEIEGQAFNNCSSIETLVISSSLSTVGYTNFGDRIRTVRIKGNTVCQRNPEKLFGDGCRTKMETVLFYVDRGMYDYYVNNENWVVYSKKIISEEMLDPITLDLIAKENESALYSELGNNCVYTGNLKIRGSINGYDLMTLRNKTNHLLYLDLSEVDIVANDGGYEYYSGCSLSMDNELGDNCFRETNLKEIILPKSLKKIGEQAFCYDTNLESVKCGENLESIGFEAFVGCAYLKDINLPNSLISIGTQSFMNCSTLGPVVAIPDKIMVIEPNSFWNCTSIDSLYLGRSVIRISVRAFCNSGVRYIQMNRQLSIIEEYAFQNCVNLIDASLPYSVTKIGNNSFENCKGLKSVKVPSMAQKIGDRAFYGCNNIRSVYTYTVEPTAINQNTFSCFASATLNVPKASANLYVYNTQWSQFTKIQEFDEPYDAFYLNGDFELDEKTGRMSGEPDAQMYETSGLIIEGDSTQELSNIELLHDGTNGGSIIGAANDVTGQHVNLTAQSLKVNISVDGNRWYFFCFPFDVEQDSVECTTDYVFYAYDGDKRASQGSGWTKLDADFGILNKGEGYIFQASRTGILTIHVGNSYLDFRANDEKEQLSTYTSQDASNAHWNFIGNPYISYYDVQDLAKEYDAPIVIWNGNGYDAYKPGDDDYQLHPFQAFFVQKETGSSYVEFLPENRITYNQAETRSSLRAARRAQMGTPINLDRQLVNIVLMGQDSITDRTRIVYSVNASMDYEIGVDAAKFQADGVPQLYTLNGKTKYAINERPMGSDEIKLGYTAPKAGTYTLSVTRHDAEVEIYDNVAKSKVDFTFGDYSFESAAGTFNDRFVVYKTGGGVTKVEDGFRLDGMTVRTVDGGIVIEGNMTGKVQVYSDSGMLLAEPRQAGRVELGDGVYIIKVGDKSVKMSVN